MPIYGMYSLDQQGDKLLNVSVPNRPENATKRGDVLAGISNVIFTFYRGVATLELGRGVPVPVPPVLGPGVAAPVLDVDTRGVPRGVPRLEPGRGVRGAGALPAGCPCPFETFGSPGGSAGLVRPA